MAGNIFLEKEINVGKLTLRNRLVMPAMQTDKARMGRGTEEMYKYYGDRSKYSRPGLKRPPPVLALAASSASILAVVEIAHFFVWILTLSSPVSNVIVSSVI